MDPASLPQAELKALTEALLDCLVRGAGEHRKSRFHVDVEGASQPELPDMTRGGNLVSTDRESKGKPFISGDVSEPTDALLKATTKMGSTLYLVQYDFVKEGPDWRFTLKVQSLEEYRELCAKRRPLDDALVPTLLALAEPPMPDWREIRLDLSFPAMAAEKRNLFASVKELQYQKLEISGELTTKIEEFRSFYRSHGFELQIMKFELLGGRKKMAREIRVMYG